MASLDKSLSPRDAIHSPVTFHFVVTAAIRLAPFDAGPFLA